MWRRRIPAVVSAFALLLFAGSLAGQEWTGKGRISGVVKNQQDQPIQGATVTLHRAGQPGAGPEPLSTDKKGRWDYLGLAGGTWVVTVEAEGYQSTEQGARVSEFQRLASVTTVMPADPMAAVNEGNALLESGDFAAARAKYLSVLSTLDPGRQAALGSRIGDTYFEEGNLAAAQTQYEKVLPSLPADQQVHVLLRLGESHSRQGNAAAAREHYERAIPQLTPPEQSRILSIVAQLYDGEGDRRLAIETLQRADSISPQNPLVLQLIADLLTREGRDEEAQAYLSKLPEGVQLPADILLNLGIQEYNAGNLDEAFGYFDRAADENPDSAEVYYYRGLVYLSRAANSDAAADFSRFLELAPEAAEAEEARNFLEYLQDGQ